jgi:polysaccharide deacetylase family protein (PEP-CTERM system associated)
MKILTFDIEEWFHILDNHSTKTEKEWANYEDRIHQNMDRIFRFLADTNQSATFFCLGWVAEKYPDVIKKIDDLGYEIGTHSHLHQLAYEQTPETYEEDLKRSLGAIENVIGKKVISYRAPGFSITAENLWAFEILHKNGIEIDSSVFPAQRSHGGLPKFGLARPCLLEYNGITLKEFPINTAKILGKEIIYSGGGYFRLFPALMLENWFQNHHYVMTYFHPRDFDAKQPMIKELSLVRKFKSYYGLGGCEDKLVNILRKMPFSDMKTAVAQINWNEVDKVAL